MLKQFLAALFLASFVLSLNGLAQPIKIVGQVVGPDGAGAAGATVVLYSATVPTGSHPHTITEADGRFEFTSIDKEVVQRTKLRAYSADKAFCCRSVKLDLTDDIRTVEVKLVIQPSWKFHFNVTNATGEAVTAAEAVVVLPGFEYYVAQTDARGRAEFTLPQSEPVRSVATWKDNVGLDYHSFTTAQIPGSAPSKSPVRYPEQTTEKLVLRDAKKIAVQVVDDVGTPIANANVCPIWFSSKSEPNELDALYGAMSKATDDGGIASFAWIPTKYKSMQFDVRASPNFVESSIRCKLDSELVQIVLERPVKLRGQVTDSAGQRKAGIKIVTNGFTYAGTWQESTTTDEQGRYELNVKPNGAYIVAVKDKQWAAPPKDGIVVVRGSDIEDINFQLSPATQVRGRLLDVATRQPAANETVLLERSARKLSDAELVRLDKPASAGRLPEPKSVQTSTTDADGFFEFFAATGDYNFRYMGYDRDFKIDKTGSIQVDLPTRVKARVSFTGDVVNKATGAPLADIAVYDLKLATFFPWSARSDDRGRFTVDRPLEDAFLIGHSSDYKLAGIAHVSAGEATVRIECLPTVTAKGKFEAANGQPLANRMLTYETILQSEDSKSRSRIRMRVETDENGEFTIAGLWAGQEYAILIEAETGQEQEVLTTFKAEAGETVDLGILRK